MNIQLKTAFSAITDKATRVIDMATCHHFLYFVMFVVYAAAELHLADKGMVSQVAMGVYFTMSMRPFGAVMLVWVKRRRAR